MIILNQDFPFYEKHSPYQFTLKLTHLFRGENFGSLFKIRENAQSSGDADSVAKIESIYSEENLSTYYAAKEKVKMAIATAFELDEELLGLASPTFFSRITGKDAKTPHDEYWHSHIDSNQYPSFDYTGKFTKNCVKTTKLTKF